MSDDRSRNDLRQQRLVNRDLDRERRHRRIRRQRIGAVLAVVILGAAIGLAAAAPWSRTHTGDAPSSAQAPAGTSTTDAPRTTATATAPAAPPPVSARTIAYRKAQKRVRDQNRAISRVMKDTWIVTRGSKRKRKIALTFDDGPSPYTTQIMRILRREKVPATFFQVGSAIPNFPSIVKQQSREGFVLGDHTESHANLGGKPYAFQAEQIDTERIQLKKLKVPAARLFRPPYGVVNHTTGKILKQRGMLAVLWTVDTEDWRQPGARTIVERGLAGADNGAIILMHDGGGTRTQTVDALTPLIRGLKKRGYQLVSVPELLAHDPPPRNQPLPGFVAEG